MPTIAQLEKLLQVDPDDPFVHYGIGQEHAKLGEHERAIECFDKALALDETYCYAYYFKAISLRELGQRDEALGVIEEGLSQARRCNDGKALSELATLRQTIQ